MSDYYWGALRITNPATLQKWKDSGKYQELIDEGYIYAPGCGRFRTEKCTCHKCRKVKHIYEPNYESIEVGDKVKLSEKALNEFTTGKHRLFMSKMVYKVVDKEVNYMQGVRLKLHCGTTLMKDEAVKVDKNTPLRT